MKNVRFLSGYQKISFLGAVITFCLCAVLLSACGGGGGGDPETTWYQDSDGDGYSDGATISAKSKPSGYYSKSELTATSGDCNDNNAGIHPGATEICGDGIDQDCNGSDLVCTSIFSEVCSGSGGIAEAAPYNAGSGTPHTIVLLEDDGIRSSWNDDLPTEALPDSVNTTELVACIETGSEEISRCSYLRVIGGGMWYVVRERQYADITLFSARTGEIVAPTERFYGSYPSACPSSLSITTSTSVYQYYTGEDVSFDDVMEWLSDYL